MKKRKFLTIGKYLLMLALLWGIYGVASKPTDAAGTWTACNFNPYNNHQFINLMADGSILTWDGSAASRYYPDSNGNYVNGTYVQVPYLFFGMSFGGETILNDDRLLYEGGEYRWTSNSNPDPNGGQHTQIYNPITNSWTLAMDSLYQLSDAGSCLLADGTILQPEYGGGGYLENFNPSTDAWSFAGTYASTGAGEGGMHLLKDGTVFQVMNEPGRYNETNQTGIPSATCPINDGYDEEGVLLGLQDGRLFYENGNYSSAFYTPPTTSTGLGSWTLGPNGPLGDIQGDTGGCLEPNGLVMVTTSAGVYEINPTTNTAASITGPPPGIGGGTATLLIDLPNGQLLCTTGGNDFSVYTPSGAQTSSVAPTVTSVTSSSGVYTLTGTQLFGCSNGAAYGDDENPQCNIPIVSLKSSSGKVYYCRSYGYSTRAINTGSTAETCKFVLPAGVPSGSYSLYVSVNAEKSSAFAFSLATGTSGTYGPPASITTSFGLAYTYLSAVNTGTQTPTLIKGSSGTFPIDITSWSNQVFSGTVALSVAGLPSGVTAAFSPASVTLSSGAGSSTMTLTASGTATAGTYLVTITGTSGSVSSSEELHLTVAASGATPANGLYLLLPETAQGLSPADQFTSGSNPILTPAPAADNLYMQWQLASSGGYYTITNPTSGNVLTDTGTGALVSEASNGTTSQQWTISSPGMNYQIVNRSTGKALDATANAALDTGALTVSMSTKSNVATQRWALVSIPATASSLSSPNPLTAFGVKGQVVLNWWQPTGYATSYNIYRGTSSGGESATPIATVTAGNYVTGQNTSYTDSSVTAGTTYYYEIKAVNASTTSGYSIEQHAAPVAYSTSIFGTSEIYDQVASFWTPSLTNNSDMVDDPSGGGNGTGVDQQAFSGSNQMWTFSNLDGTSEYKITSVASGCALTGATAGSTLTVATYTGAADQLWYILPVTVSGPVPLWGDVNGLTSYYNFVNVSTGQVISDWGGGIGTPVGQAAQYPGGSSQIWSLPNTNLALTATASTSSDAGGTVSLVNDNSATTYLQSANSPTFPQTVTLTWPSAKTVSNISIVGGWGQGQGPTSWTVQSSTNGTSWTNVTTGSYTWQYNDGTLETANTAFASISTKYLRVQINGANLTWGHYAIAELQAH